MTYYIKGGSKYNSSDAKAWMSIFLGGYSDAIYDTTWQNLTDKGVETNKDPYWRLGSSSGGAQTAEIGLLNDYRIEIDQSNGIRGWDGIQWIDLLSGDPQAYTSETGWDYTPAVTISFTDGSRTFTITPDGATFDFVIKGTQYTITGAESVVIDDTEGLWYIYYDEDTLTASQTPWVIKDGDKAMVSVVYWDATNNIHLYMAYELHTYEMSVGTHYHLHDTFGARYQEGLDLTQGSGGTAGQIQITAGEVHDEDISIDITDGVGGTLWEQDLGLPAKIPVYYRSGASAWRKYDADDFSYYDNATVDRIHYNKLNGTWASAECTNPYHVAYWIYATNNQAEPIIAIMGQREDLLLANAKDLNQIENMNFGTLPFTEMKILYRIIWKSSTAPAVAVDVLDLRSVSNVPGGTYVPQPTPTLSQVVAVDDTLLSGQDINNVSSILFDITNGAVSEEGRLKWNATDGTLEVGMPGGSVNLQIGQEMLVRVRNVTGVTILNGKAVRINGVSGNNPTIGLSDANDPANAGMIGLATEDIAHNDYGYVTTSGMVRDVDTLAWSVSDRLFVSQTPGELTNVYPSGTDRIILAGIVIKDSETEGIIWVLPINQAHLSELSSVTIASPADNEVLAYDSGTGTWINQTPAEAGLLGLAGGTMAGDLDLGGYDIERLGTIYHADSTGWLLRVSSDGYDTGSLYNIGVQWDTGATKSLRVSGYNNLYLGVHTNSALAILNTTDLTMAVPIDMGNNGISNIGSALTYINGDDFYCNAHIRIRGGHSILVYDSTNADYVQVYHDGTNVRFIANAGAFNFYPSNDNDDYLQIRTSSNTVYIEAIGAPMVFRAASTIYWQASGDAGDYVQLATSSNNVTMSHVGSGYFRLEGDQIFYLRSDSTMQFMGNHGSGVGVNLTNTAMYPTSNKGLDLGGASNSWDDVHYDDLIPHGLRYVDKTGLYDKYKNMEIVPHPTMKTSVGDIEIDATKIISEITQPDRYEKQYKRKFVSDVAEILKRTPEEVDTFVRTTYLTREDCPDDLKDRWRKPPELMTPEEISYSLNQWVLVNTIVIQELMSKIEILETKVTELEKK